MNTHPPQEPKRTFSSLRSVARHLRQAGFKISKSKLSRDKKKGLICVNPDGTINESEVRAYTVTLERLNGNIQDLNDIHTQKTASEVKSIELKIAKQQFELDKDQGKYVLRQDFESELAARAVVFDSGFRHLFNTKVREWIVLVGGKVDKSADFLQALNECLDAQLNEYASIKSFKVIFEAE